MILKCDCFELRGCSWYKLNLSQGLTAYFCEVVLRKKKSKLSGWGRYVFFFFIYLFFFKVKHFICYFFQPIFLCGVTISEYTDEEGLIPKGSSVIVRRVPKVSVKKTHKIERSDALCQFVPGAIKAMDDYSSSKTLPLFSKMVNLAAADVSEDDKIKVMMNQSSYDPMTYSKKSALALPANYTCFRCGNAGHHIRKCPYSGDKNFDTPKIKKSTGIPRSFMVEVDDPNIKGAMLTNCGRFAIPAIDAQAYAIGKKEKHPFLHQEENEPEDVNVPVPEELQCLICHDLLVDSVVIPCCGNSYCDDCIRTALLDSEGHICPTCNQSDVSPDTLIANKFLRQAVNNFKKEKGYSRSLKEKSATLQPVTATPTPNPVPTPLTTHQQKVDQSTLNQQCDHKERSCVSVISSSCLTMPVPQADVKESAAHPVSSLPPSVETEGKPQEYSVAITPSVLFLNKEPMAVQTQPMKLVHNDPVQKVSLGQTPTSMHSSSSSSVCPKGISAETHPLHPSSSTNPPALPPLFLSHQFPSFPPGQPFLSRPPGHPLAQPNWTHPNPQGAPIPPLIPSSSSPIPPLIQREWFSRDKHRRERSLGTRSTYRRSSRSKSKSRSSSRSSRSRSKSHGRSRSPYSHHRVSHTRRTHPSRSYSYGYKRSQSPTPSSSSSPREDSRSASQSDHRKKRHHSRKSSHSSYKSRRRVEPSPDSSRQSEGHSGQSYATEPTSAQEANADYYQQWKRQYKEWYDKYFSSYVSHYHCLPPPPNPLWVDGADNHSSHQVNSFNHHQRTHSTSTHRRSPPSHSSCSSRSSHSQSSSEGRSPPSRSLSNCSFPPSRSPSDTRSPPSENVAPQWWSAEKDSQEQGAPENSQALPAIKPKHESKYDEVVSEDNTRSTDAAHSTGKKDKKTKNTCSDSITDSDAIQNPLKSNKKEKEKQLRPEGENKRKRGKDSNSLRQDGERGQTVKLREKARKVDKDTHPEVYKASKPERKRKKNEEKSPIIPTESEYMQSDLETPKDECPQTGDKEMQQEQKEEEKKPLSPRVENIWEEGMKVKPQKKISIKLEARRPEEKTEIQEWLCSEKSDTKDDVEELEAETLGTEKQQATGLHELGEAEEEDGTKSKEEDERPNIKEREQGENMRIDDGGKEIVNVKEEEMVTNDDGEKQRPIVKDIREDESVRNDERGIEQSTSVATTDEKTTEEENVEELPEESKPEEELVEGVKMKIISDEDIDSVMMSHSNERLNITAGADSSTYIVDHGGGEESVESRIAVTTPPQEQKRAEDDTPELMQVPFFTLEKVDPGADEQQIISLVPPRPPVTPGHGEVQGDNEQERQRLDEMQTDDEIRERNFCLAPSSGQYRGDVRDTELEGKMGADRPVMDWTAEGDNKESHEAKEEVEKEFPIPPKIQSLTKDREEEVNMDASEESNPVNHNECTQQMPDVKYESTKKDYDHISQNHNNDNMECKSNNRNSPLPSIIHLSERLQGPAESSLAFKPSDEPLANPVSKRHHKPKAQAAPLPKHSDTTSVKVKPMSREELWKKYKLEKLLKESQQEQAGKEAQPETEASRHHVTHEPKVERVGGETPSDHNSVVMKKSEHERRTKKHKRDKQHGDEELERKHRKSKKNHDGSQ
ncbi:E3 ubiquitin-protein ligase RBBP6 isoform X3 [Festucalex cinctus]